MIVRAVDDEARVDGRADVDDLAELFDTDLGLEDARRVRHGRRADLSPHRRRPQARRQGRGRRADADGRDDRRPRVSARCSRSAQPPEDGPEDDEADR